MKHGGTDYEEEVEKHEAFGKVVYTVSVWHPSSAKVPLKGHGSTEAKARAAASKAMTEYKKGLK